jgi:hypothetical protein
MLFVACVRQFFVWYRFQPAVSYERSGGVWSPELSTHRRNHRRCKIERFSRVRELVAQQSDEIQFNAALGHEIGPIDALVGATVDGNDFVSSWIGIIGAIAALRRSAAEGGS